MPLPILINGAGVSGLALGQGLLKANIPFRIFERDPALNVRSQGYRVRVHSDGISALTSVLTPGLFSRLQASCPMIGSPDRMIHAHLDALTAVPIKFPFVGANKAPRPAGTDYSNQPLNADRAVLRSVLAVGLESFIEYGKDFIEFKTSEAGVIVRFSDGSEVHGSLLIGADGVKSRTRGQLLSEYNYLDTEGRWFFGKTVLTPELEQKLNQEILGGMSLIQDRSRELPISLLLEAMRFKDNEWRKDLPKDYIYWVFGARKDTLMSALSITDQEVLALNHEESAAATLQISKYWNSSFHALFEMQDISLTSILKINSSPSVVPEIGEESKVTLMGDAIHAMSPTAGLGATTALRDAEVLSRCLEEDGVGIAALRRYESEMRIYAQDAIKSSYWGGKMLFGMRAFEELAAIAGKD
ncbi:hypothetical protein B7494_g4445 [Chlorociboria aeruginascens]|nr:hypothetical protein B7494_g4445 [Chlorociboria aeruginascens]